MSEMQAAIGNVQLERLAGLLINDDKMHSSSQKYLEKIANSFYPTKLK